MEKALRIAWTRSRPIAFWGALVAVQAVGAIIVLGQWIDPDDREWLTLGAPVLLALGSQPVLGAILGARLFSSTESSDRWLPTWAFGALLLQVIPLPAEVIRTTLAWFTIDQLTRADREAWLWLVLSAVVSSLFYSVGTAAGQLIRRAALASIAAYGVAVTLWSVAVVLTYDRGDTALMIGWGAGLAAATLASAVICSWKDRFTSASLWGAFAALALVSALTIGGLQHVLFVEARENLRRDTRNRAAEVENARTTAVRLPEFRKELETKQALRHELRLELPETLGVPRFMETLEAAARRSSVRIVDHDVSEQRFDFYDAAELAVEVEGDPGAINELEDAVASFTRLTHWRSAEVRDGAITVRIDIYAMPAAEYEFENRCTREPADTRILWHPFQNELVRLRDERTQWCAELERLLPIHRQVDVYSALLAEIEELERLIERLQAD